MSRPTPQKGKATILLVGLAVLAWLGYGLWTASGVPEVASLNIFGGVAPTEQARLGGRFKLVDQQGHTRTDAGFRGQLMLIYFGYTYCPDVCPTSLQTMTEALDSLGESGNLVRPIFITIDPARDTVEVMHEYAANFHPRLVALTGTEAAIAEAAKAYRVYYARAEDSGDDDDYLVDHTGFIYLMGVDGRYLKHFSHTATIEEVAEEIGGYL